MKKIKNLSSIFLLILIAFVLTVFTGCTKEAKSQDKLSTLTMGNPYSGGFDSVFVVKVAPNNRAVISIADSSNSTVDTFKVYLEDPFGNLLLASLTKSNDTTANILERTKNTGTILQGDAVVAYYEVRCPQAYAIRIVRTNVASINGTLVAGKRSHVTVFTYKVTSAKFSKPTDLTYQTIEKNGDARNPGFY